MQSHGTQQNKALDLASKLKARMEEQTSESQQIMQDALQSLSSELQKSVKHELHLIQNVLADGVKRNKEMQGEMFQELRRTLILPVGITVLVTLLGCAATIGMTSLWINYEKGKVAEQLETNRSLEIAGRKMQEKVNNLWAWQITPHTARGVRFLKFPKGTGISIAQTNDGSPAVVLEK